LSDSKPKLRIFLRDSSRRVTSLRKQFASVNFFKFEKYGIILIRGSTYTFKIFKLSNSLNFSSESSLSKKSRTSSSWLRVISYDEKSVFLRLDFLLLFHFWFSESLSFYNVNHHFWEISLSKFISLFDYVFFMNHSS